MDTVLTAQALLEFTGGVMAVSLAIIAVFGVIVVAARAYRRR